MVKKDLHTWQVFLISFGAIILVGFIKVLIKAYPDEVVIGGIIAITLGYFGKRIWQKHKSFNSHAEE